MKRTILSYLVTLTLVLPLAAGASVVDDQYWDDFFVAHGPDQFTDAILYDDGAFYMGGNFLRVGDINVKYIARWMGEENWEPLGSTGGVGTWTMGLVHTMALYDQPQPDQSTRRVLFVGGMFDQIGIWRTNNIAMYDIAADTWVPLGDGTNRAVRRVIVGNDGDVYVAGEFTEADGQAAQAVARYDGNRWYSLGSGLAMTNSPRGGAGTGARAMALAAHGDGIFVGGMFDMAGGVPANYIAYWDGSRFHALGNGLDGFVNIMTLHGNQLYVGGDFINAGGQTVNRIARWDINKQAWYPVGQGFGGVGASRVRTITPFGKWLFVGGEFSFAGTKQVNNIACWDGHEWQALGTGVDDEVKVITRVDDMLYVGGNFENAGGRRIGFLTRWLGTVLEFDGFDVSRRTDGATLSWAVSTGIPVTRYHVYRDGELLDTIEDPDATAYTDASADPLATHTYALGVVRAHGMETMSEAVSSAPIPTDFELGQNYPNPFNPSTTIEFTTDGGGPVRLSIHDVRGAEVAVLYDATPSPGTVAVDWDGTLASGAQAGTGIYFYRLERAGSVLTKKMVLLK